LTTNAQINEALPGTQYLNYFAEPRQGSKYSLYEAMRLLGCRGEGTEWEVANPANNTTSIGNANTVEAHVFENRPGMSPELATVEWICMAPAEFSVYLPFYGNLLTKVFEKGYLPDTRPYNNTNPDDNSMYWVFRELYAQCSATTIAERERLGNGVKAFWERYQKSLIEQQAVVDGIMQGILSKLGYDVAEEAATDASIAISAEAYEYAKQVLAELKAFKAASTPGPFTPSALLDEGAIPHYTEQFAKYDITDYDFTVYLESAPTAAAGDAIYVDVMLAGDINYTQINASIAYDAGLLEFASYANLSGLAAEIKKDGADKISVRSVPSLNMMLGAPCNPPVKVVTLKFTVKDAANEAETVLSFGSITVNPTAGAKNSKTAPGKSLTLSLWE